MKQICDFRITDTRPVSFHDFILEVRTEQSLEIIQPGQFVSILIPHTQKTFLRRPISIYDMDYATGELRFYIRIVGEGTQRLSALQKGETLNIIYPLGNTFTVEDVKHPLLIGGGCGIAPLLFLATHFMKQGIRPTVVAGAQTAAALCWLRDYDQQDVLHFITDDGSLGKRGQVIDHSLLQDLTPFDRIYSCGPTMMMKEVAKLSYKANIPCEVSLENTMACAIGACLCCVTETITGNSCVCTDGPIFDICTLKNFM
jgi:dihydroorotate dehydrogenase electron transfer subunit